MVMWLAMGFKIWWSSIARAQQAGDGSGKSSLPIKTETAPVRCFLGGLWIAYRLAVASVGFGVGKGCAAGFRFESSSLGLGKAAVGWMADFNKDRADLNMEVSKVLEGVTWFCSDVGSGVLAWVVAWVVSGSGIGCALAAAEMRRGVGQSRISSRAFVKRLRLPLLSGRPM